jgi:DNA-binding NarL/FixJ family response regulator
VARTLRVVVVDDQLPFRIALVERVNPDVVVLDMRMPGMDGPTAARVIAERWPSVAVVLCSSHSRDDLPVELAAPFVPKELLTAAVLQDAVREHANRL